jgi:ABC-type phosphate/phosphonate transport system substrate-binding protein
VLEVSEPEAAPAFVAAAGLPGALRALLSMALSGVGSTPEGQAILDDLGIVAFVPVEDRLYDGVRALRRPGEGAR